MSKKIRVLSIDGGGIRGIIPAMIMAVIEARTQKPIAELFDMIAGTSTGGILAMALTKPLEGSQKPEHSAQSLVRLYETEGQRIFPQHTLSRLSNLIDEKYSAQGLEAVLEKYLGATYLSEALADILIPSYDIELRRPYFFKSFKAKLDTKRDFPMKKVARATSAAPTYFEPLKLETNDLIDYYALIDGGVVANNPAMSAYVEAKSIYKDATDFLVVSLGTGEMTARLYYDKVKNWGLLEWAQPILNIVFDGSNDAVDYQLKELLSASEDGKPRYYRFQTSLSADMGDRMDDASPVNIIGLKRLAQEMIDKNSDALEMLCQQLTDSFNACKH
ncbi:MAG: patatin-like phospholipase family protein [Oscillatoria sp. Prado101]|nr:patatin-like phospholipase family protein [Oscillatoria sp. Prado101]